MLSPEAYGSAPRKRVRATPPDDSLDFQIDEYGTIGGLMEPSEAPAPPSTGHDRIKRMFFDFVQQEPGQTRAGRSLPSKAAGSPSRSLRTGQSGRHPISRRPLCLVPTADLLLSSEKKKKKPARPTNSTDEAAGAASTQAVARVMQAVRACHRSASPHLPASKCRRCDGGSSSSVSSSGNVSGGNVSSGSVSSGNVGSGCSRSSAFGSTAVRSACPVASSREAHALAAASVAAAASSTSDGVAAVMQQVRYCHRSSRQHLRA